MLISSLKVPTTKSLPPTQREHLKCGIKAVCAVCALNVLAPGGTTHGYEDTAFSCKTSQWGKEHFTSEYSFSIEAYSLSRRCSTGLGSGYRFVFVFNIL